MKSMGDFVVDQIVVVSLVLLYLLDLVTELHDHEQCLLVFSSTGRTWFAVTSWNLESLKVVRDSIFGSKRAISWSIWLWRPQVAKSGNWLRWPLPPCDRQCLSLPRVYPIARWIPVSLLVDNQFHRSTLVLCRIPRTVRRITIIWVRSLSLLSSCGRRRDGLLRGHLCNSVDLGRNLLTRQPNTRSSRSKNFVSESKVWSCLHIAPYSESARSLGLVTIISSAGVILNNVGSMELRPHWEANASRFTVYRKLLISWRCRIVWKWNLPFWTWNGRVIYVSSNLPRLVSEIRGVIEGKAVFRLLRVVKSSSGSVCSMS